MGGAPSREGRDDDTLLVLDLCGGWIGPPEVRVGDWFTKSVMGIWRPYAVVKVGDQTQPTDVVKLLWGHSGEGEESKVKLNFDRTLYFPVSSESDTDVEVEIYDKRYVQALARGSPLVGSVKFKLSDVDGSGSALKFLQFHRNTEKVTAELNVQLRLLKPASPTASSASSTFKIPKCPSVRATPAALLDSQHYSLGEVMRKLSGILKDHDGIARLMDAWPDQDRRPSQQELEDNLVACFHSLVDKLGSLNDDQVILRFAPLSRKLYLYVKAAQPDVEKPEHVVCQWVRNFFMEVSTSNEQINEERLARFAYAWIYEAGDFLEPVLTDLSLAAARQLKLNRQVITPWKFGDAFPSAAGRPKGKWELGSGQYGSVWRGRDRVTGEVYAVKRMEFGRGSAKTVTKRECEVTETLCRMSHPCVVRLYAVIQHDNQTPLACSLIMEYCGGGSLDAQISKNLNKHLSSTYTPPKQWRAWLAQIVMGLEHLHLTVGMLVRDIKPQNIVLDEGASCAKLADFGMSKVREVSTGQFSFAPRMPPGSPHFVAPEVLFGKGYDRRADYYSLGVLTWVLVTGGLRSFSPDPQPPCASFRDIEDLAANWELLKDCVHDPEENDARPVPDDDLKEFILTLTNRKEGHDYMEIDHPWIHNHPLFATLSLPPTGASVGDVEAWLELLRTKQQ